MTRLPPRSGGLRQRIWATLGFLMFAGFLVAMVVFTGPPLVSDWQIHATAQPAEQGRIVKGSCTTKIVLAICDLTLSNRTAAGTTTRSVNYAFTDLHFGDYSAAAMVDPAYPELITTDLGLDKLWNRTLTFLGGAVLMLGFLTLPIVGLYRKQQNSRATS
ncbi:MAG: hypothetical protein ACRYF2_23115 [Janthinobacterium lividum]